MKSACEKKGNELRSNSNAQGVVVRNLLTVTETTKWTRVDVLQKVDSGEAAFRSWRAVRGRAETQRFLAVLLAKSRP